MKSLSISSCTSYSRKDRHSCRRKLSPRSASEADCQAEVEHIKALPWVANKMSGILQARRQLPWMRITSSGNSRLSEANHYALHEELGAGFRRQGGQVSGPALSVMLVYPRIVWLIE